MADTKYIKLCVPTEYVVPSFFEQASAYDVAAALDVASKLPSFLNAQAERYDVKRSIRTAVEEAQASNEETRVVKLEEKLEHIVHEKDTQIVSLTLQRDRAEFEKETMARTLEERLVAVRNEESLKARQTMQDSLHEAHANTMKLERDMCEVLQDRCKATEENSKLVSSLQSRIHELETPMGRGSVGEVDVAQCLRDMGFVVEDTSMGDAKNAGYLDLLIRPEPKGKEDYDDHGMRIAIEVKNRKDVKRENIVAFEDHVRNGIDKGLFDSAIFVSIRAHVKRDGASALDMYEDEAKRPLVPVSWIGPERGKHTMPLTHEQLETHVMMHCALLSKTRSLRDVFAKQAAAACEEDKRIVQQHVEDMVVQLNDLLSDMSRQQGLLQDLKTNLTSMRVKAIQTFVDTHQMNKDITWLGSNITAPWLTSLEHARRKVDTHTDAQIWNECSQAKAGIERTVSKEAFLKAARVVSNKRAKLG